MTTRNVLWETFWYLIIAALLIMWIFSQPTDTAEPIYDYHLKMELDKDSIHIKTKHGERHTIHADSLQQFINQDNL